MTARNQFKNALADFIAAGHRLADKWQDDAEGWNADDTFGPLGDRIIDRGPFHSVSLLPLSFDEWLAAVADFYEQPDCVDCGQPCERQGKDWVCVNRTCFASQNETESADTSRCPRFTADAYLSAYLRPDPICATCRRPLSNHSEEVR